MQRRQLILLRLMSMGRLTQHNRNRKPGPDLNLVLGPEAAGDPQAQPYPHPQQEMETPTGSSSSDVRAYLREISEDR